MGIKSQIVLGRVVVELVADEEIALDAIDGAPRVRDQLRVRVREGPAAQSP